MDQSQGYSVNAKRKQILFPKDMLIQLPLCNEQMAINDHQDDYFQIIQQNSKTKFNIKWQDKT